MANFAYMGDNQMAAPQSFAGDYAGMTNYGMSNPMMENQNFNTATPGFTPTFGMGGDQAGGGGMNFFGSNGQQGWGGTAMGAIGGMANLFMGMKQYGLAKKTLAENKRQFELNYGAQRQTTNTQMADRQAARVASNPGAYQSVGGYMEQNGIK